MKAFLLGLLIVAVALAGCLLLAWVLLREAFGVDVED